MLITENGKGRKINTSVQILLEDEELEFDDIIDALDFVVEHIAEKIIDDFDISRLIELDYVGDRDDLLSSIKGKKHIKKFGKLENMNGNQLYINVGGNRTENITKINQLASLFSFMRDFKIIN
ncbi:hypothetical protein [Kamptonema sp. UHCC 0994]|uniref:hypothetical protein n=1 Tax=Kamptonema sp. UHCC 0994 TaxID=3031329 RepID=UPI0023B8D816|nr:hypothetical protein [Kamptonema sp. UHCC 0994]MDF0555100.1 hypothetical protein [Kamptonema sp. UHCC 0994]